MENLPVHVAIIMDGNGRWALSKGKSRIFGHYQGAEIVEPITLKASSMGIKFLTLFAFSTENWKRPKDEVELLFSLFKEYLLMKRENILKNNIKMKFIGRKDRLKEDVVRIMEETENITKNNSKITLTIAIDYGAKDEIIRAIKKLSPEEIKNLSEDNFKKHLDTSFLPPVDLLIRTAGEKRISNFLLWDIAYAELYFTATLWPDFTEEELEKAVHEFSIRERRFGAIKNA